MESNFLSIKMLNLINCNKHDIKKHFENSYELYEGLFSAIIEEKYFYMTPERLRLPLIFYLGHTATLYINKMMLAGLIKERVNPELELLLETGVDEMSWDDTENFRMGGTFKWPSVHEVMEYRTKVKNVVYNVIESSRLSLPIHQNHPWWSLIMAIEHERIHLETSSVLLRQLPKEYLKCPVNWKYAPISKDTSVSSNNNFIEVEEGDTIIGKPKDFPTFGWDNEYGETTIHVPKFEAMKYSVTNREFREFVEDGGYDKKELWSVEGWQWVQSRQAKHPTFWICHRNCKSGCGGSELTNYSHCTIASPSDSDQSCCNYKYRAVFDMIEMPWEWPVDVNFHEAKAYCKWKGNGYRLLTEAEHNRIRGEKPATCDFNSDELNNSAHNYNINLTFGSSSPVNYFPPNKLGFYDVYGNVYEWIEDHFNGLPGFETNYLYEDYSSPFFDSRHGMMMGGSWVSSGDQVSRFCRMFYRRHFFQHAGFRIARSLTDQATPVRLCQADHIYGNHLCNVTPVLQANLEHSYFSPTNPQFEYDRLDICEQIVTKEMGLEAEFCHPLVSHCENILSQHNIAFSRAAVLGCGPGYSTLLLTKTFQEVIGVDYGGRLVALANEFKNTGHVTLSNGEKFVLPLQDIKPSRALFKQFTWIPNELIGFNFILFESLDRFNNPKGWLLKLHECLVSGSVLIVSGSDQWTSHILQEYLSKWFELIDENVIATKRVTTWKLNY